MMRSARMLVVAVALLALMAPTVATAATIPPAAAERSSSTFDTPRPTPPPGTGSGSSNGSSADPTARPAPTKAPGATDPPRTEPPVVAAVGPLLPLVALPQPGVPAGGALTIAYRGDSVVAQAPLLLAQVRGYFADAGLLDVLIVRATDPAGDVASAATDIGVVRYKDLDGLTADRVGATAIAGYQNYAGKDGSCGGDALVARPGLVQNDPASVVAFLTAYVRALQELGDPETVDAALLAIDEGSQISIGANLPARWAEAVSRYGPFDGGFGSVDEESGLGELTGFLSGRRNPEPDLEPIISAYPLNLAQASLGLPLNPGNQLIAGPGVTDIRIGLPGGSVATSPISMAAVDGYFSDLGFSSVEIVDVERALPGVMTSQLDFAVVDLQDLGDGVTQGLPLTAIAGHRNYRDGNPGGDVVVASPNMIEEGATVAAFLVAYIRGLEALGESVGAEEFAPFDGGFGERSRGGGLADISASLARAVGDGATVDELISTGPLTIAQAWWGLPANPTTAVAEDLASVPSDPAPGEAA